MLGDHVDNWAQFAHDFEEAVEAIATSARYGVEAGAREVIERAKSAHPYTDRTGDLTDSIGEDGWRFDRRSAQVDVVAAMPYASFVERGTSRSRAYPFLEWRIPEAERSIDLHVTFGVSDAQRILDR